MIDGDPKPAPINLELTPRPETCMGTTRNPNLTDHIIGLAIKVQRNLGPGLLEFVYSQCLRWKLHHAGLNFKREVPLTIAYEDLRLERAYQADIIVEDTVLLELKSVDIILPIHEAQTLTYLRLSNCRLALLMNFNSVLLKDGLRRFIETPH
jgi:GxxExxY protein